MSIKNYTYDEFHNSKFSAEKSPARPAKGEAPPKGGPREVQGLSASKPIQKIIFRKFRNSR
jgi:hypothetical protein